MTLAIHTDLPVGEIHIPYNWVYADQSAREAAVGFYPTDVGKLSFQESDKTLWMLDIDDPPEWVQVAGGGGGELTIEAHKVLRQLIHFIADGPAEGFASGAYKEVTGTVFPTAIVWYNEVGVSKKKIVEKLITWSGAFPSIITWKVYDAAEVLLATVTDTITYAGAFETSRTRSIL